MPTFNKPYYLSRYFQEQIDEFGYYSPVFFAPEKMQEGFDDGAALMGRAGQEILTNAGEVANDLPRASGLSSCQISVLARAGMLDMQKLTALIVREFAEALLDKLPKVRP